MAKRGNRSRTNATKQTTNNPGLRKGSGGQLGNISNASSQIVKDAAALLDEELAVGIVTAKKMQQRFREERRIEPADFKDALQRFQGDAHEIVNLLNKQVAELRSQENSEVITRLVSHSHDLLDLAVGLVNTGVEVTNQLVKTSLPKQGRDQGKGRSR